jgi:hypothetical protein
MIESLLGAPERPAVADPLDPDALKGLVHGLAGSPGMWAARVRHDVGRRLCELLWRDERVEVWLICWAGGDHDTGFHDHGASNGAFALASGHLIEERLGLAGPMERRLRPGESVAFTSSYVHRVRGTDAAPAVSIHAYSPPLDRLGVYALGDDGALRRETVPATHELGADAA